MFRLHPFRRLGACAQRRVCAAVAVALLAYVSTGAPLNAGVLKARSAASVSLFAKPVSVYVAVGFAAPYARLLLSAVTVSTALVIVSVPSVPAVKV